MTARGDKEEQENSLDAAFDEFCDAWFSENPIDPDTFCRRHSACGPDLRGRIEGFLLAVEGLPDMGTEDGAPGGDVPESLKSGGTLGDFRIIREIGRGGMGTVYEAEQISLGRAVALKVLQPSFSFSSRAVEKFKREALAGGRQHHPGIVAVHAMGEHEGVHYIAQELVEGGSTLADSLERIAEAGALPSDHFQTVAKRIIQVADALEHAHASGVIHRDVKPSNILITRDGEAKVTDFGLAKIEDALALSRTGDFAGTPFYMSPEQAAGRPAKIDSRTDIYSLGVTLYEALTGRRPFEGKTSHEVLKKIVFHEPKDPRKVCPSVPRDLSVITLHAMEKSPEKRYGNMGAFSEDLRRFLRGDVIRAKPAGPATRMVKRVKRNPWAAGVLVLALLLMGVLAYMWATRRSEDEGRAAKPEEPSPIVWSDGHTGDFITHVEFSPDGRRIVTAGDATNLSVHLWDAFTLEHLNGLGNYTWKPVGGTFSPDGESILLADTKSGRADLLDGRSGEKYATLKPEDALLVLAAFSPDGQRIVTSDDAGRVLFWDARSAERLPASVIDAESVTRIAFDGEGGRVLTTGKDGKARLFDAGTGERLATLGNGDYRVDSAYFGQDGEQILTYDEQKGMLCLWSDRRAERCRTFPHDHAPYLYFPYFDTILANLISPDGRRLVTSENERVLLRDLETGEMIASLQGRLGECSPDGERLVTLDAAHVLRLWEAKSGALIKACNDPAEHRVELYRFSPDGRWIAAIHRTDYYQRGQSAWIWDGKTGDLIGECTEGKGTAIFLNFSPSGDRLAKSGYGAHVGLWACRSRRFLGRLMSHSRKIQRFDTDPSGPRIVTVPSIAYPHENEPLTARLWDLGTGKTVREFEGFTWGCFGLDLSPDGTMLAVGGRDRGGGHCVLKLFDAVSGKLLRELAGHEHGISYAAFSPDGERIVSLSYRDETARVWNVNSGEMIRLIKEIHRGGSEADIPRPAFSPGGDFLLLSHNDDTTKVYDGRSGRPVSHDLMPYGQARFSPDGRYLVISNNVHFEQDIHSKACSLWDGRTWMRLREFEDRTNIWRTNFSHDGERLVTGGCDGVIKVWDVEALLEDDEPEAELILRGHSLGVKSVAFSPDDERILTAGKDTAYLWDARTGKRLFELKGHASGIWKALYTCDGTRIVTGGHDATVRVWNADEGRLLLTRVDYENGHWLAFEPQHGYYIGTRDAAEWACIRLNGRLFPLSSYAAIFLNPEKVKASLEVKPIEGPRRIPAAPELHIASPASGSVKSRSFLLAADAEDPYGIEALTVVQDGNALPASEVEPALNRMPGGRKARLSMELSIPEDRTETTIQVRARNLRGILSKRHTVFLRLDGPGR